MGASSRVRLRAKRVLIIMCALIVYVLLVVLNIQHFFLRTGMPPTLLLVSWTRLGFSALVALLFLSVGVLIWLYARNRLVAGLLFSFCTAMMVSFTAQTAAKGNDPLFSLIGALSSASALLPFAILLLLFPHNYLSSPSTRSPSGCGRTTQQRRKKAIRILLRGYVGMLLLLDVVADLFVVLQNAHPGYRSAPLSFAYSSYYLLALTGILCTLLMSYRKTSSLRERQQQRLFVGGILAALIPCFILTVLPVALHLSPHFIVDSQLSTLTVILLPLALGYAILRYQIFVVDAYIRRMAAWIMGSIGLSLLVYLVVILASLALHRAPSASTIILPALVMAPTAPFVWRKAQVLSERFFFPEIWHYRRLLEQPVLLSREPLNLEQTCQLLSVLLKEAFESAAVCLFVLEKEAKRYNLAPLLNPAEPADTLRRNLLEQGVGAVRIDGQSAWLDAREDIIERLAQASRPLFLSEVCQGERVGALGLTRYLAGASRRRSDDPLLAPIWAKGEMIGVLMLGERGDRQPYAGPDFEAIHLILSRYASDLDSARMALDLRMAYEHQKELDRLKDQFIITASHELRTPLTAVQGYIELLGDFDTELPREMRAAFLQTARHSCEELTLMVDTIMDASRVEINVEQVKLRPIMLATAVLQSVKMLETTAKGDQHSLHIEVDPTVEILADDVRLQQVLLNLMSNALKYSPAGTPVEVSAEVGKEEVTVRVRDYGLGVPPEEQMHLFERFVRLERDMNSPVRGVGLGLYISKQLVEAMGGRIWVESTGIPGEGSIFSFTLALSQRTTEQAEEQVLITVGR